MGLEALLLKLENRKLETPVTPCNLTGVTANPALSLARTLETPETPQIGNGGSEARKATATASPRWLLHCPDAIAAQPINQAEPETAPACSTCAHVTGRGGCGEPIQAGLSDLDGVIVYSPDQGATCPAWLASISGGG